MDSSVYKGSTITRAFYHRRHGIVMEIALPEPPVNPSVMALPPPTDPDAANLKILMLISSSVISKN